MVEIVLTTIDTLPELVTEPEAAHQMVIRKSSAPTTVLRISWANLKKWILGNRTIGGTAAGDIVTTNASQTQTNKRMDNPAINSANPTGVTSEDLDKVSDLQEVVRADFLALAGTTGALQPQIDAVVADAAAIQTYLDGDLTDLIQDIQNAIDVTPLTYTLEIGIGAGVTSYEITEATILTALGLAVGTKISHLVMVAFGQNTGSGYETSSNESVVVLSQVTSGITHLNKVTMTVVGGKLYWFKLIVNRIL